MPCCSSCSQDIGTGHRLRCHPTSAKEGDEKQRTSGTQARRESARSKRTLGSSKSLREGRIPGRWQGHRQGPSGGSGITQFILVNQKALLLLV